jgi:putative peptidoglycan binding protein
MLVLFPRKRTRKAQSATAVTHLRRVGGLVAAVPPSARSGRVRVAARGGRRSNAAGPIRIVRPAKRKPKPLKSSGTALDGTGVWIWYVSRASGGDPAAIVAQAQRYGVRTVFVKSSDGTDWWEQFSPALVAGLKAGGLNVCAWQFVYGSAPAAEADLGLRAAQTGADCLVIDAESAYQGRYVQAQTYIRALRAKLGPDYAVGLSTFPYVDYHPAFPYSVFLGPGGAQHNLPQVYWKTIGTTVDAALAHTYVWNRVYERTIFPLGQLYSAPRPADVRRFRQLAAAYGASGMSWWSWQHAASEGWEAIGASLPPLAGPPPAASYPLLKRGSRGDAVVAAQERLASATDRLSTGQSPRATGTFDAATEQAVRSFQGASGLLVTGQLDAQTWPALLRYDPAPVDWAKGARTSRSARKHRGGPRSANLPAPRNELRAKSG